VNTYPYYLLTLSAYMFLMMQLCSMGLSSQRAGKQGDSLTNGDVMTIFDQIPIENQRIIRMLVTGILRDVEHEYITTSLMNWENLSIVFTPNFIRSPSSTSDMDRLTNQRFETRFIRQLFIALNSPPTSSSSAAASASSSSTTDPAADQAVAAITPTTVTSEVLAEALAE
jgi:hypothetical protein